MGLAQKIEILYTDLCTYSIANSGLLRSISYSNILWLARPPGWQPNKSAFIAIPARVFYHRLRQIIAQHLEDVSPFVGPIEVDERYFGAPPKGKRGRGAGGKVPVFGILHRGRRVYTKVIPMAKRKTLMPIMEEMLCLTVLSTAMPCATTMRWMWQRFAIFGSIIRRVLSKARHILT